MFVSTIIPTIGRSLLDRAVESVIAQQFSGDFEIIVVNDSGRSLEPAEWQQSPKVTIVSTHQRERSIARNTGAALSTGKFLHFLDDDDWLFPEAYQSLYDLAISSGGLWLYGGTQLVDRQGNKLIELHHQMAGNCAIQMMAGEWIPLQSSWIDANFFFTLGGFNPLMPAGQDTELMRRIALNADVIGTTALISWVGVGAEGSSTDTVRRKPDIQISRERVLEMPGTFSRLRAGATSAYWSGRLARIYLSSAVGNFRQGRITTVASRSWLGFMSLLLAGGRVFSPEFWLALTKPYRNDTYVRGFKAADQQNQS